MKRLCALVVILLCVSCRGSHIDVPQGAAVVYEDHMTGQTIEIQDDLADDICMVLRQLPDEAEPNAGMGLATRRSLRINGLTFQVLPHKLILLDDWGVRTWRYDGIQAELDFIFGTVDAADQAPGTGE